MKHDPQIPFRRFVNALGGAHKEKNMLSALFSEGELPPGLPGKLAAEGFLCVDDLMGATLGDVLGAHDVSFEEVRVFLKKVALYGAVLSDVPSVARYPEYRRRMQSGAVPDPR